MFEITCVSCGEKIYWGTGINPKMSRILVGDFVMLCQCCGQALAEGEYVMRVIAPQGVLVKGFHVHCRNCGQDEHWTSGKQVGHLHIGLSGSATVNCNCGANVWNDEGTMLYAWIDPSIHAMKGEE